jgi:hypothetical protein
MVVATRTVETATTSSAPVVECATLSGLTAGTVRAGGAITGGRVCADGPPAGKGEGADGDAGGDEPRSGGTVAVAACEGLRTAVDGEWFGGAVSVGAGSGVAGAGLVQQGPSPWW